MPHSLAKTSSHEEMGFKYKNLVLLEGSLLGLRLCAWRAAEMQLSRDRSSSCFRPETKHIFTGYMLRRGVPTTAMVDLYKGLIRPSSEMTSYVMD
jgi:hypothetical protein